TAGDLPCYLSPSSNTPAALPDTDRGDRCDPACGDELSQSRLTDPHMMADLDELDPPLRDEPPDEADRRTQSFRSSLDRQQLVARRKMGAAHAASPVAGSSPPGGPDLRRASSSAAFHRAR